MKNKRQARVILYSALTFAALLTGLIIKSYNDAAVFKKHLLTQPVVSTCTVTDVEYHVRLGYSVSYLFTIDNARYYGSKIYTGIRSLSKIIVGKQFPLIYNTTNPGKYNVILLLPENFKEYNMKFPKSLAWLLPYING